jgi:hypothetical protein
MALFPGIPKEDILKACTQLTSYTSAKMDDDHLRVMLELVWFSVNRLLNRDPSLNRNLASLDEFKNNVNNRGEDRFFNLLRDTAEDVRISGFATRWAPIFLDGMSISFPPKSSGHFPHLDVFYSALEGRTPYAAELTLCAQHVAQQSRTP